ncbi:hypothetical protein NDU88_005492 [Pleurodeles waltl]|uniref:Uncharacterized protein n=1 Tax=Pleurodeles waltl TaxID=8319 RepID=A0AAV7X0T7_PLEWA|nr:hypothetical protein NDU88_005492 [Pleurodeles waltl]
MPVHGTFGKYITELVRLKLSRWARERVQTVKAMVLKISHVTCHITDNNPCLPTPPPKYFIILTLTAARGMQLYIGQRS